MNNNIFSTLKSIKNNVVYDNSVYDNNHYDKYELEEFLKKYLEKEKNKPKTFDDATIQDLIEKFGTEKILEAIGEDKVQDFIRKKKIKRIKDGM